MLITFACFERQRTTSTQFVRRNRSDQFITCLYCQAEFTLGKCRSYSYHSKTNCEWSNQLITLFTGPLFSICYFCLFFCIYIFHFFVTYIFVNFTRISILIILSLCPLIKERWSFEDNNKI